MPLPKRHSFDPRILSYIRSYIDANLVSGPPWHNTNHTTQGQAFLNEGDEN
jgi:hypothetical protein